MFGLDPNPQRPSRSMLRKVFEFGSVLEHVCQLWGLKVVDWEVISGALLGGLLEVSWGSLWKCPGGPFWGLLELSSGIVWELFGGPK